MAGAAQIGPPSRNCVRRILLEASRPADPGGAPAPTNLQSPCLECFRARMAATEGGSPPPAPFRPLSRRSGRFPALPYSGSEGEMLRKGFSTVVAAARCGNGAFVYAGGLCQRGPGQAFRRCESRCPPDTRMSEDRVPSGGMHFAFKRILRCRLAD
jgi:hypothetical protein